MLGVTSRITIAVALQVPKGVTTKILESWGWGGGQLLLFPCA